MSAGDLDELIEHLDALAQLVESWLIGHSPDIEWQGLAFRWTKRPPTLNGQLEVIHHPQEIRLDDLLGIEHQKSELVRNTRQFLAGKPANNALLWGSRGTGKSSLIKALLTRYAQDGLRIIEVDRSHLIDLPEIVEPLYDRTERFILFSDDLSFEADDPSYKALKASIEGSLTAPPENVLIYATSNRRHLLPEYLRENQAANLIDGEIHHGEAVEEKISLSERFGLWLAFHPFSQDQYLDVVTHYLARFGITEFDNNAREQSLRWALARGSRSGRVAWQFARDWAGRKSLHDE